MIIVYIVNLNLNLSLNPNPKDGFILNLSPCLIGRKRESVDHEPLLKNYTTKNIKID
jgi:hypothetical protein